jgi:hypothetical protein
MTAPDAARGLAGERGANVFIRGVLHVLNPGDQAALVENLRVLAGSRGTVFLAETNFQGNPVDYVSHLGATTKGIPAPLERAIRELPMPGHFGPGERARLLPGKSWELLDDGRCRPEPDPRLLRRAAAPALGARAFGGRSGNLPGPLTERLVGRLHGK